MDRFPALSLPLVTSAVDSLGLRYTLDADNDVFITFGRDKGKDVHFLIVNPEKSGDWLVLRSHVWRLFPLAKSIELMVFCNSWAKETRVPRAAVVGPVEDGDIWIVLDYQIRCEGGVGLTMLQSNVNFFIFASMQFWDALDAAM